MELMIDAAKQQNTRTRTTTKHTKKIESKSEKRE
jgi:hypothetical protein